MRAGYSLLQFVFANPCTALSGRCSEHRTEIGGNDALAVELAQNVQIIEISHMGVGGGTGHDGF